MTYKKSSHLALLVSDKFFGDAGINGYEYLDKIVQIPFAWPSLVSAEKASLTRGYLTGDSSEECSLLKELAKKLGVETNRKDVKRTKGVVFEGKSLIRVEWRRMCQKRSFPPLELLKAFPELKLLDLRDNEMTGKIPAELPFVVLADGNPSLKGRFAHPSHFWNFKTNAYGTDTRDVKDACSDLMATLKGGAKRTEEGLVLRKGKGGYAKIDNWEWGGTTSFEVFVKYESFNENSRVFCFGSGLDYARGDNVVLANLGTSSTIRWAVSKKPKNSAYKCLDKSNFDSSTWTHVVVTVKDATMKVYKNGVLVGTKTDGWEPTVMTRTHHWLGRSTWTSDSYFDGTIAYLKMWRGVELSADNAKRLYDSVGVGWKTTAPGFVADGVKHCTEKLAELISTPGGAGGGGGGAGGAGGDGDAEEEKEEEKVEEEEMDLSGGMDMFGGEAGDGDY